ncbi:MAG: hypothetical protein A2527_06280 [Candidatus Lambdaproteobacteria bacterium RIFOXYD2_FULL_50_16]|uniref:STAS/SEC14 domain-containing protein n=1 Tax=Candidatus Lambdaproteobacteria bacterium RIFOXYD2_FULL_50_16 TaxID=1817772 RepID=A0A1F6GA02_9PROT|nr:MAG: hypothetical protein A2527_06280 [Candidatus Lambdaproteobacteria bacterium RIFOXYD2_FULL_50_16]
MHLTTEVPILSLWVAPEQLLVTRLSGVLDQVAVERWLVGLTMEAAKIPQGHPFKALFDLRGAGFENIESNRFFRQSIPQFLSDHGFWVSYLTPEETRELRTRRQLQTTCCLAMALLHHDEIKMGFFQKRYGHAQEGYFANEDKALGWLKVQKLG